MADGQDVDQGVADADHVEPGRRGPVARSGHIGGRRQVGRKGGRRARRDGSLPSMRTSTSDAGAADDTAAYRLPTTVLPRRYRLILAPDLAAATFTGEVEIDVVGRGGHVLGRAQCRRTGDHLGHAAPR